MKTKPTQHSVQKLREIGIQPDTRSAAPIAPFPTRSAGRSRCSPMCPSGVISVWDADTIYKLPRMLHAQGLDEMICAKLHRAPGRPT